MKTKITLLDLFSGRIAETTEALDLEKIVWNWTEGNWSCDCNRMKYFMTDEESLNPESYLGNVCEGNFRFLVTAIESLEETAIEPEIATEFIKEANSSYASEMRRSQKYFNQRI